MSGNKKSVWPFKGSVKQLDRNKYPETEYFLNPEKSDVVFIVEDLRAPAIKSILSISSPVFKAMFSGSFKESKDKEVVIKDTTYDAFKALLYFIYSDQLHKSLDFKTTDNHMKTVNLELCQEVVKLSDRFQVYRLIDRIGVHLKNDITFESLEWISGIAFDYNIKELFPKIKEFIETNLNAIIKMDMSEVIRINEYTDNCYIEVITKNNRKTDQAHTNYDGWSGWGDDCFKIFFLKSGIRNYWPFEGSTNELVRNKYPEMDYFMNEEKSDVVFIVEGKRVPAIKSILSVKSSVFKAMFSGNFKESKDNEVVIEDTTYEAFKAFIYFLYSDQLDKSFDIKTDDNRMKTVDLKLSKEVVKLSDKYQVYRLIDRIGVHSKDVITFENLEFICGIAFEYNIKELIPKIKKFIADNFNVIKNKDMSEVIRINEYTHNCYIEVLTDKYQSIDILTKPLITAMNENRTLCYLYHGDEFEITIKRIAL